MISPRRNLKPVTALVDIHIISFEGVLGSKLEEKELLVAETGNIEFKVGYTE